MRRRIALAIVLAVALAGGFWWWRVQAQPPAGWQGYVDADYVRIGPTQAGLLVAVSVSRGDAVRAGAPLFAQDDVHDRAARDEARAQLAEAEARLANLRGASRRTEIAQAEADLADLRALRERAARDLARMEALVSTGTAPVQRLDQARADARSASARVQAAEARLAQMRDSTGRAQEIAAQRAAVEAVRAALAQAEWRLDQRRMTAPVSGRVSEVYARPGETMSAGAPVVSLLPPDNILVRFFVPEPALADLRLGDTVRLECDRCPPDLTGRVSFVAPQAEYTPPVIFSESAREKLVYLIEARPPAGRAPLLKPGQPVTVLPANSGADR